MHKTYVSSKMQINEIISTKDKHCESHLRINPSICPQNNETKKIFNKVR